MLQEKCSEEAGCGKVYLAEHAQAAGLQIGSVIIVWNHVNLMHVCPVSKMHSVTADPKVAELCEPLFTAGLFPEGERT